LIRVSQTSARPDEFLESLPNSELPAPFELVCAKFSEDPATVIPALVEALRVFGEERGNGYFSIRPEILQTLLKLVPGKLWNPDEVEEVVEATNTIEEATGIEEESAEVEEQGEFKDIPPVASPTNKFKGRDLGKYFRDGQKVRSVIQIQMGPKRVVTKSKEGVYVSSERCISSGSKDYSTLRAFRIAHYEEENVAYPVNEDAWRVCQYYDGGWNPTKGMTTRV
jgi:hypothetical protein